jgi:GT2 family glycosyltransferase
MLPTARTRTGGEHRLTPVPQLEVSVVVASHERARRLVTLLDALAAQTLPRERWELIVVHTYAPDEAERLLDGHELSRSGLLRHYRVPVSTASPASQRNRGWRDARAPLVAFTDDDCRPREDWLENLVEAASGAPGAIVQGATRPDPRESENLRATHVRTLHVNPPGRFTQTCNILYPRALLDRVGGFDEVAITGEDIDLALRGQAEGARLVGEPGALVYHAVEALTLREKMRSNLKWQHLAYIVKRHPELREHCHMRVWWKTEHFFAAMALIGLVSARRHPWLTVVAVRPFCRLMRRRYPDTPLVYLQMARGIPEQWLVELVEIGVFFKGSVRYRTLLL